MISLTTPGKINPSRGEHLHVSDQVRSLLVVEFENRRKKNPSYSLRALARDLSLNQSFLTKVFKGKRRLGIGTAMTVALALGIPGDRLENIFRDRGNHKRTNPLNEETLSILTDWHPFAVIELAQTDNFISSTELISNRLGLFSSQVDSAIRRLVAAGILKIDEHGDWHIQHSSNNWASDKYTSLTRKRLQKQILNLANESIDNVPFDRRENVSMTIAINEKSLPEIRRLIREFTESLRQFISSHHSRDSVYQFAVAAFPLTKDELNFQPESRP